MEAPVVGPAALVGLPFSVPPVDLPGFAPGVRAAEVVCAGLDDFFIGRIVLQLDDVLRVPERLGLAAGRAGHIPVVLGRALPEFIDPPAGEGRGRKLTDVAELGRREGFPEDDLDVPGHPVDLVEDHDIGVHRFTEVRAGRGPHVQMALAERPKADVPDFPCMVSIYPSTESWMAALTRVLEKSSTCFGDGKQ